MSKNLLTIAYIVLFLSCTDSKKDFKLHQIKGDDINLLFTYENRSLKTVLDSLTRKSIKIDSFKSSNYSFDNTGKIIFSKYPPLKQESVFTYDKKNRVKSVEEKRFMSNNKLFTKTVYDFRYSDTLLTDIGIYAESFSNNSPDYSEHIKITYDDEDIHNDYVSGFIFNEVFLHMRAPFYLLSDGELPKKRIKSVLIINPEVPSYQKEFLYKTDASGNIVEIRIKEVGNHSLQRDYQFKYYN